MRPGGDDGQFNGGLNMGNVIRAAAVSALLAAGFAVAGCNTIGAFDDPGSGYTDDPAVGFSNIKPDSEEYFVVNIGRRVYFTSGSAELDEIARETLDLQAAWLVRNRKWLIKLQGFADDPGSDSANVALSKKRAEAVMDYLASKGVDKRRMWAKGYGKERLVRNCASLSCKAQNRRVNVNLRKEFDAAAPQYAGG